MNPSTCEREPELLDALGRGYVGGELSQHVDSCPACSELRTVAGALLEDRAEAVASGSVPSSGTMWWRLRLRERREAEASARRSFLLGQAITLVVALALVVALLGGELVSGALGLAATIRLSTPLVVGLISLLVIAPIAGWVALRQK